MITEQDLKEAIAECEGSPRPNANTCVKLAAFYTIQNQLFGTQDQPKNEEVLRVPSVNAISYESGSEFSSKIDGKKIEDVIPIIDELMETLMLINPRLYNSVMQRL